MQEQRTAGQRVSTSAPLPRPVCCLLPASCCPPAGVLVPCPALLRCRYEDADIHWQRLEEKYHFSCQFTADLIAMNHADFIVTSTYQVGGPMGDKGAGPALLEGGAGGSAFLR